MKKILHLATFEGNSGDMINHIGFYRILKEVIKEDYEIVQVELRDFYKNKQERSFDNGFLCEINDNDLFVIGGGNFFDVRWCESNTGTTLDFSDEFLEGIKTKVLVNAIGYTEHNGILNKDLALSKFNIFLEKILSKKNWLVTVRNEGSKKLLQNTFNKNVFEVADNGFFYKDKTTTKVNKNISIIGFNLNTDLFHKSFNNNIDENIFIELVADYLLKLIDHYNLILFMHTPQDIQLIGKIINCVGLELFRSKITIAPYCQNENAHLELSKYYSKCDIVISMRFHSNVLCFQLGVPVIALIGHEKISHLYNSLNLNDYFVMVDNINMFNEIDEKIKLVNSDKYKNDLDNAFKNLLCLKNNYKQLIEKFWYS